jgi:peptidoglycan glycosyltransferase
MNRAIMKLFGVIVLLFAVLAVFTSRWTVFDAQALRDNHLNRRAEIEKLEIHRGAITAADGSTLARSVRRHRTWARVYPHGDEFAHELGYYDPTKYGEAGLERSEDDALSGNLGPTRSLADLFARSRPTRGDDVHTTLDPAAQRVAVHDLDGRPGAVVALDPHTGAVRVMASVPSYDPNTIDKDFPKLSKDSGAPLINRAVFGAYPPGSTFKVVDAAAALGAGKATPQSIFDGSSPKIISGTPLSNDAGEQFGDITLTTALTHSVNTVFAPLTVSLGAHTMSKYMKRFGFYSDPPLDLPSDEMRPSGNYVNGHLVPVSNPQVDLGRMGIGQDNLEVTPMQMAMVTATIANGGVLMRPHIVKTVIDPDGRTVKRVKPSEERRVISAQAARGVAGMMANVVREGTGVAAQLQGIEVAGKTGTADTGHCPGGIQAWFIAFAPVQHPRAAVAATVECASNPGAQGATVALPIAKDVLETLLH